MTSLRGQSLLVVGAALFVILLAIFGIWELQRETDHAERLSGRSDARLFASQSLLLRLVDAETGVRGYAATGDRRFLDPYQRAELSVPPLIRSVRGAGVLMPATIRPRSESIAAAAATEMLLIGRIYRSLALAEHVGLHADFRRGKVGMDAIRASIDRLQSIERLISIQRRERAARDQRGLSLALDATFALSVVVGIGAMLLFINRIVRRLAAVIGKTEQVVAGRELGPSMRGGDEIAAVDRAVHRMALAIRTRNDEVTTANRVLDMRNLELSAAYNELERFSYSISHDLRAPVRTIGSFSKRLEQGYGAHLDPEGSRLLGIIKSEAARLGCLIDDLLEFSRLGRQQMKSGLIEMTPLVREVAELARERAKSNAVLTVTDLPNARGDRVLLRQVWENLISNALKYSGSQARPVVTVSGSVEDGWIVYRVADNGVGFDMKYAHKLFNVFERLHRADEFEGVGVGLAIVKRIVERHGGHVSVTAEPNGGAVFSFALPVRTAA